MEGSISLTLPVGVRASVFSRLNRKGVPVEPNIFSDFPHDCWGDRLQYKSSASLQRPFYCIGLAFSSLKEKPLFLNRPPFQRKLVLQA